MEALVAVMLVGVGLLAYGVSSGTIVSTNAKSEKKSIGVTLAQDKMENIKDISKTIPLTGADSMTNPVYSAGSWSTGSAESLDSEGNSGGASAYYARTWTISEANTNLYDVTATVTWGTHVRDTVTLQTRITR